MEEAVIRVVLTNQGGSSTAPTRPSTPPAPSTPPPPIKSVAPIAPEPPAPSILPEPKTVTPPAPGGGITQSEYDKLVKDFGAKQAEIFAAAQGGVQAASSTPSSTTVKPSKTQSTSATDTDPMISKLGTDSSRASDVLIAGMTAAGQAAKDFAESIDSKKSARDAAAKRLEREDFQKKVDAEYDKLKPPDSKQVKKPFDDLLDAVESMRGTIGGTFGKIAGIGLDLTAKARALGASGEAGAAGAEAGGAGASGMMAAAGPIGIAVATALALDSVVKSAIKGTVQTTGRVASALSSPDESPNNAIKGVGTAMSDLGEKIPFVGQHLVLLGEAANVAASLMDNFNKTADKYAEYNPQIAQAQAMAEMRSIIGNMQRAQQSGGELSRFIQAQSEMQQKFEEIKIDIWMKILPAVTGTLTVLNQILSILPWGSGSTDEIIDPTSILISPAGFSVSDQGVVSANAPFGGA